MLNENLRKKANDQQFGTQVWEVIQEKNIFFETLKSAHVENKKCNRFLSGSLKSEIKYYIHTGPCIRLGNQSIYKCKQVWSEVMMTAQSLPQPEMAPQKEARLRTKNCEDPRELSQAQ